MKNKNIIKQEKELKLTVSTITRSGKKIYYNNLLSEKKFLKKCAEASRTTTLQTKCTHQCDTQYQKALKTEIT